jgi:hypothetical protein
VVNGKITVVGIVSFGRTTCTPLVANGYERVTFQKDWILSNSDAALWQCNLGNLSSLICFLIYTIWNNEIVALEANIFTHLFLF